VNPFALKKKRLRNVQLVLQNKFAAIAPMYILDTDHMSLLERASSHEAQRLHFRLKNLLPEERVTTIISFEEQVRGWMSLLAKARDLEQQIFAYEKLKRALNNYSKIEVLDFNNQAAA
jgi:tRNA(fMet)-specific endonuclease VapC